ncbi:MAG: sigma-54-dependent Fis family transcriptional regulator [Candidatus Eisenbacteria bacterium]|nr:sigma-54-dependent Fis family transcriptional regulator [Candidatus Eisenbacteria bacterium]
MDSRQVLICGRGAERIGSFIEERSTSTVHCLSIEEPEDLSALLSRSTLGMVIVIGRMFEDAIFQNWLRRRLPNLPLVWITDSSNGKGGGNGREGVTVVPRRRLDVLPYLIEFARDRTKGPRNGTAAIIPGPEGETVRAPHRMIVGRSPAIRKVLQSARKILNVNSSLLIRGESGTGKELIAAMVHHESLRLRRPFVKVNCAAIPETLLESELFGIEKNIATNVDMRVGKFEQADGGTIFLDEIGDMSLLTQSKVLRILQEREFERVGGGRPIRVNVRIIAATNKDLVEEIRGQRFREDLYYRLNVITITIPPLRERIEDVPPLVEHFVDLYCRENGLPRKRIPRDVLDLLQQYSWPGNVRELENAVEHAVVVGEGEALRREDLPPHIFASFHAPAAIAVPPGSLRARVEEFERNSVVEALERNGWVQARAARELGISERSMWHLFKKYDLAAISRRRSGRGRPRSSPPAD